MGIHSFIPILCFFFLQTTIAVNLKEKAPPKWNPLYTVSGVLSIPYAELSEPFYAWYDEENGKSRIDYYGGMAKTYQFSSLAVGGNGASYKIIPITTEEAYNVQSCVKIDGGNIQSVLPNLEGFEYLGKDIIREQSTQKWRLITTVGDKTNKYTIWIKFEIPNGGSEVVAIPVRYEMKGYNTLFGSHYDHYYLDYDAFDVSGIADEVFEVDKELKCGDFPGPGKTAVSHIYSFNPMKEFIHPAVADHVDQEFNKFIENHNRDYQSQNEHLMKKEVFRQNLRYIHSMNRANRGYTLKVTRFADKTPEEMSVYKGRKHTTNDNGALPFPYESHQLRSAQVPDSFDWRIAGAVTPVKDQSVCGSCWAFGTTGTLEGAYFLKSGNLVRLSPQALVDCSWGFQNNGCDGGEDFRAYAWVMKHGGIPIEEEYGPYLGQDGYCHADNVTLVAPIKGYVNVTSNEDALKLAIFKHGPISISIDAGIKSFPFYSHGVFNDPKCKSALEDLDHSVLAVGYGTLNGEPYWLVKNSWSNMWGNDGYILISRKNNICGVTTIPTYVLM